MTDLDELLCLERCVERLHRFGARTLANLVVELGRETDSAVAIGDLLAMYRRFAFCEEAGSS